MSFFEWITRRPGFRLLEDSFAINRESMLTGLQQAIAKQQKVCDEVWLVAHFFDTFVTLQDFLETAGIDYQIVDQPPYDTRPSIRDGSQPSIVRLVLATLIADRPAAETVAKESSKSARPAVAIVVCERHPHHAHDKRLCEAAKKIDALITFG